MDVLQYWMVLMVLTGGVHYLQPSWQAEMGGAGEGSGRRLGTEELDGSQQMQVLCVLL